MSFTVSLQQRIQQLKKAQADISEILYNTAKHATERAVEAAADATPPKKDTGRGPYIGTNTITGQLKSHWDTDSIKEPMGGALSGGSTYVTVLANNMKYASYVNDGHRMDKHFVPGLYLDPESGLLAFDPEMEEAGTGGIVVGTKTKYVKGEFMVDKAKKAWEKAVFDMLDDEIRKVFE